MKNEKPIWTMKRSEAITILLSKEKYPMHYTNLRLAELLEIYYPQFNRTYIVKEDEIPIDNQYYLSPSRFFHEK